MRIYTKWNSDLGDFLIEVEADTVEEMQKLTSLAQQTHQNMMNKSITEISKRVNELKTYAKIRQGSDEDDL